MVISSNSYVTADEDRIPLGQKIAFGVGIVGFDPSVAVQPQETLEGLKLAYIVVPVTGTSIAMAVMFRYDLSEERAHEIRAELETRRASAA